MLDDLAAALERLRVLEGRSLALYNRSLTQLKARQLQPDDVLQQDEEVTAVGIGQRHEPGQDLARDVDHRQRAVRQRRGRGRTDGGDQAHRAIAQIRERVPGIDGQRREHRQQRAAEADMYRWAMDRLRESGCDRILVVPLYPQYAESSFETAVVETKKRAAELGCADRLTFLPPFYDRPEFIEAFQQVIVRGTKSGGFFSGFTNNNAQLLPYRPEQLFGCSRVRGRLQDHQLPGVSVNHRARPAGDRTGPTACRRRT